MTAADARFVEVYESYFRLVYGYCLRRTSPDKVDDAVADTFLVAWRRISEVPAGESALPWLYGVAYKVLSTQWRSRSRRDQLAKKLTAVGATPVAGVEDHVVVGEEVRLLLDALSRLRGADQEIIRLAVWEELPHADIGAVLDISPYAAKQRLYQARKKLKHTYERLEAKKIDAPAAQKGGGLWSQTSD